MGGIPIKGKLLHYLTQKAGERIFLKDIAENLNESERRVQSAMNELKRGGEPITVDVAGQAWTYRPNGKPDKPLYEYLTTTKSGELVLQGTDGTLLLAREL